MINLKILANNFTIVNNKLKHIWDLLEVTLFFKTYARNFNNKTV